MEKTNYERAVEFCMESKRQTVLEFFQKFTAHEIMVLNEFKNINGRDFLSLVIVYPGDDVNFWQQLYADRKPKADGPG